MLWGPASSFSPAHAQALGEVFSPGGQPQVSVWYKETLNREATVGLSLHQPQGGANHTRGSDQGCKVLRRVLLNPLSSSSRTATGNILTSTHLTSAMTLASPPSPETTSVFMPPFPLAYRFSLKGGLPEHGSWVAKPTGSWPGQAHPVALCNQGTGEMTLPSCSHPPSAAAAWRSQGSSHIPR